MQLHKHPLGLLELFNLKTLGQAPDKFADTLAPMSDVTDFYGITQLQTLVESLNGQTAAIDVGQAVPAGEYWRVHAIGGFFVPTGVTFTSAYYQATPVLALNGSSAYIGAPYLWLTASLTGAVVPRFGWKFDRPLLLPPGAEFGVLHDFSRSAGTLDLRTTYLFERLTSLA
jgi:hypothetical protein